MLIVVVLTTGLKTKLATVKGKKADVSSDSPSDVKLAQTVIYRKNDG